MIRRSRKRIAAVALALGAVLTTSTAVAAGSPTCSDFEPLGVEVHGQHIVRDYVSGGELGGEWPPRGVGGMIAGEGAAVPGGPGPGFHFPNGFAPGASFCLSQSQSPGFHAAPHSH